MRKNIPYPDCLYGILKVTIPKSIVTYVLKNKNLTNISQISLIYQFSMSSNQISISMERDLSSLLKIIKYSISHNSSGSFDLGFNDCQSQ